MYSYSYSYYNCLGAKHIVQGNLLELFVSGTNDFFYWYQNPSACTMGQIDYI